MNPHRCCDATLRRHRSNRPASHTGRVARGVGAFLSTATLILMPKCPVCLAAYVALATGVSLSATAASNLRMAALIVSFAVLSALAVAGISRMLRG